MLLSIDHTKSPQDEFDFLSREPHRKNLDLLNTVYSSHNRGTQPKVHQESKAGNVFVP